MEVEMILFDESPSHIINRKNNVLTKDMVAPKEDTIFHVP